MSYTKSSVSQRLLPGDPFAAGHLRGGSTGILQVLADGVQDGSLWNVPEWLAVKMIRGHGSEVFEDEIVQRVRPPPGVLSECVKPNQ
jgi:hypothetical protein